MRPLNVCRAIQKSNCYHDQGHDATCRYGSTRYMVIFGLIQVIVSQIPDFQNMKWLSIVAAVMSFTYSIIGSALGLAKVIGRLPFTCHLIPQMLQINKHGMTRISGNISREKISNKYLLDFHLPNLDVQKMEKSKVALQD